MCQLEEEHSAQEALQKLAGKNKIIHSSIKKQKSVRWRNVQVWWKPNSGGKQDNADLPVLRCLQFVEIFFLWLFSNFFPKGENCSFQRVCTWLTNSQQFVHQNSPRYPSLKLRFCMICMIHNIYTFLMVLNVLSTKHGMIWSLFLQLMF